MIRLRRRAEFLAAAKGARAHAPAFVLQAADRADGAPARVGFTVTRKIGTAVERSRIRRRLRAASDRASLAARPGFDYVIVARRAAIDAEFEQLSRDIESAFGRVRSRQKPMTTGDDQRRGSRAGGQTDER